MLHPSGLRIRPLFQGFFVLLSGIVLTSTCGVGDFDLPKCPTQLDGKAAQRILDLQTYPYPSRSFTGISFFGTNLFLSTASGLLEFENDELARMYKCRVSETDDFPDIFVDHPTNILTTYNRPLDKLVQFDGTNWEEIPLPKADYTREDVARGFQLITVKDQKWLQNNKRIWKLTGEKYEWELFELPKMTCSFYNSNRAISRACFSTIASTDTDLYMILNGDYVGEQWANGFFRSAEDAPQSDIVAYRRANDWVVVNPLGTDGLFSEEVLSGNNEIFAITHENKIFRIRDNGISSVPQIGNIYASSISSTGNLVVCVGNKGIYELRDEWVRISDLPPDFSEAYERVYITEKNGVIALALAYRRYNTNNEQTLPSKVWVYRDRSWNQIF